MGGEDKVKVTGKAKVKVTGKAKVKCQAKVYSPTAPSFL
jgi:hypothetical protein